MDKNSTKIDKEKYRSYSSSRRIRKKIKDNPRSHTGVEGMEGVVKEEKKKENQIKKI